jgi:uncharacterized protein (TIGR03067 family)
LTDVKGQATTSGVKLNSFWQRYFLPSPCLVVWGLAGLALVIPVAVFAAHWWGLAQLKGTWHVTAIEAAGKPVLPDHVRTIGLQYVFDGDKVTVRRPDQPDNTSTFTLDISAKPKRITIKQSPPIRGVYAIEGDKLCLCVMVDENPNAGFPAELASKASPKTDLLTLERR